MLKVKPRMWSYAFSVDDGGQTVAHSADVSGWRDKGEIRIEDDVYTARRVKSAYVLELASRVVARADQPRWWSRQFEIAHAGRRYSFRAKSAFRRKFVLLEGASQVGSIAPRHLLTQQAVADLPKEFPLFLQVFIIWLAMTLWKHED